MIYLTQKGLILIKLFSWEKSAGEMKELFEQAAGRC